MPTLKDSNTEFVEAAAKAKWQTIIAELGDAKANYDAACRQHDEAYRLKTAALHRLNLAQSDFDKCQEVLKKLMPTESKWREDERRREILPIND